jgi:hypothetical protein
VAAPLVAYLAAQRPSRRDVVLAVSLLLFVVWLSAGPADAFNQVERAWLVLLTGSLAIVVSSERPRGFVAAALAAVAGAAGAAAILMVMTGLSWGELVWLAERHYGAQAQLVIAQLTDLVAASGSSAAGSAALLGTVQDSLLLGVRLVSGFFPGLVLLQSLAAIALAWALYRRIAQQPSGEPLGALAGFRFNDHLIWGVAISLLVLVMPRLGWANALGGNLLVFFGGLYVVRGFAVLSALAAAGGFGGPLAALLVVFVTLFLLPVAALAALALGLTDTLVDWRRRLARAIQKR